MNFLCSYEIKLYIFTGCIFIGQVWLVIKLVLLLLISLMLLSCGIISYTVVSNSRRHSSTLAIASDVVECATPSLLRWYSSITVNETATDALNDNPRGLTMDLFSLKESDIVYHHYLDHNQDFELVLPSNGASRFIMPYNYYNRPWYMWKDSAITISYSIDYNKVEPTKAVIYLFKGEDKINSFFAKDDATPSYEKHVNMLSSDGDKSIVWKIHDNDYYYVGVHATGSKGTIFKSNVTFNFTYVDVDDYPWFKDTAQRASGVNQPLTLYNSNSWKANRTLCYMHRVSSNSLQSISIHLNTTYYAGVPLKMVAMGAPFCLLLVFLACVVGCHCISYALCVPLNRREKNGYILIN